MGLRSGGLDWAREVEEPQRERVTLGRDTAVRPPLLRWQAVEVVCHRRLRVGVETYSG